ncbi:Diphthamide biosynthesis protein 2 [Coemansia sp. S610]|nr:Diphthamide biosynthesis protein 2 [Coemansia sp. S610]
MSSIDNDGSAAIQRQIDFGPTREMTVGEAVTAYEVEQTAAVINAGNYRRVALQFPDHLLSHSTLVSTELQGRIDADARVFILADTSYGSCCVDEVAADHYSADLIVHYGRTCLSLSSRIPVFYVFGRDPLDKDHCAELAAGCLEGRRLLVMSDVPLAYAVPEVAQSLGRRRDGEGALVFGQVVASEIAVDGRLYDPKQAGVAAGRSWQLPREESIGDYTVLYLGGESLTLTNILLTVRCRSVFSYDPATRLLREESLQVNRHLARRFKMVQHARDADVIGIVVGTLAATRYLRVIEALKGMIRRAHKKFYVFVVGKLNVAKLANFAEIETYVLVACPENSLVDSKEFFAPVVTPFEMLLALSKSRQWTGDYVTDFHAFLDDADRELMDEAVDDDDDRPHFSLITGALKQSRRFNDPREDVDGEGQLAVRNGRTEIAQYLGSAGAEFLLTRSFRGLGHDDQESRSDEPALATEGRSGIARGYANER